MIEQSGDARFCIGQVVRHVLFDYRGVIVDVDATFSHSEQWCQVMARSKPPIDQPWCHVLVHGRGYETYVAERNLAADESGEPIEHHLVPIVFQPFEGGLYRLRGEPN